MTSRQEGSPICSVRRLFQLQFGILFLALGLPVTWGQIVLDDFNRPNGSAPGENWTERAGSFVIQDNKLLGSSTSLMTWNGPSTTTVSFDLFHGDSGTQYGALVLGYANLSNNLFVKVQDNGGGAAYDSVFFYYGNYGEAFGSEPVTSAVTPFVSGRVTLSLLGSVATIGIDTNFDGVAEQSFKRFDVPTTKLGTGFGVGLYGSSAIDNFVAIPEPGVVPLLSLGVVGLVFALRRRRKS